MVTKRSQSSSFINEIVIESFVAIISINKNLIDVTNRTEKAIFDGGAKLFMPVEYKDMNGEAETLVHLAGASIPSFDTYFYMQTIRYSATTFTERASHSREACVRPAYQIHYLPYSRSLRLPGSISGGY